MLILEEERRAAEMVSLAKKCYKNPLNPKWTDRLRAMISRRDCKLNFTVDPIEADGLKFLGGYLSLDIGRAIPYSATKGLTPLVLLISEALKGMYAEGESPGDLLWNSFRLRKKAAEEMLSEAGVADEGLAEEAAARSTKIWPLISMLMADDVTEGYTYMGGPLFLDHVTFGRVKVNNYRLDQTDLDKLITLVEADPLSSMGLDNPFNEVDLTMGGYRFRISLDVPPASPGAVDIRALSAISRLSLPRLIELGTIKVEEAATLLERILDGEPVLIFGRTGVGKTTLSNALLAALPRDMRLISMEEVREIEDMNRYGMHHTAYEVPNAKMDLLVSLLHRNPDVVFMGEILTGEHILAFEFAVESGFPVLATTHARSYQHLERKWGKVSPDSLDGVTAVHMASRKVISIMEMEGTWRRPDPPSNGCLRYVKRLLGAQTNEEVWERIKELPETC